MVWSQRWITYESKLVGQSVELPMTLPISELLPTYGLELAIMNQVRLIVISRVHSPVSIERIS